MAPEAPRKRAASRRESGNDFREGRASRNLLRETSLACFEIAIARTSAQGAGTRNAS